MAGKKNGVNGGSGVTNTNRTNLNFDHQIDAFETDLLNALIEYDNANGTDASHKPGYYEDWAEKLQAVSFDDIEQFIENNNLSNFPALNTDTDYGYDFDNALDIASVLTDARREAQKDIKNNLSKENIIDETSRGYDLGDDNSGNDISVTAREERAITDFAAFVGVNPDVVNNTSNDFGDLIDDLRAKYPSDTEANRATSAATLEDEIVRYAKIYGLTNDEINSLLNILQKATGINPIDADTSTDPNSIISKVGNVEKGFSDLLGLPPLPD